MNLEEFGTEYSADFENAVKFMQAHGFKIISSQHEEEPAWEDNKPVNFKDTHSVVLSDGKETVEV